MGRPKGSRNKTHVAKISLTCEHCGNDFERYPSQTSTRFGGTSIHKSQGRFCSQRCQILGTREQAAAKISGARNHNWKGGGTAYRSAAIKAYGAACQQCGYDKYEELLWVHHKDFKGRQHNNDLDNLEVLCIRCHIEKHIEAGEFRPKGVPRNAVQVKQTEAVDVRK
jgi:hypothetical protein